MPTAQRWTWRHRVIACASLAAMVFSPLSTPAFPGNGGDDAPTQKTETRVTHLIVLIGENRTFDHLFATYISPSGDHVQNLLSEKMVHPDGTPGPNFEKAAQYRAIAPFQTKYYISLDKNEKTPYAQL